MISNRRIAGLVVACLTLAACTDSKGGPGFLGGRDVPVTPTPDAPVAYAGADQDVARGAWVTLYGSSGWYGSGQTFLWTQLSGPAVTLSGADTTFASFVAPSVVSSLQFRLTVTDDAGRSSSDDVTVNVGDRPPVISWLTLTPTAPNTADPLVASAVVYDSDQGDVVTLTWEWRRNGVLVPGQAAATLPARIGARGDVVEVTLRATDGQLETAATASVTVRDAPAALSITGPEVVTWGAPFTFSAAVSDPDGDPVGTGGVACELRRGPAGMTITPACEGAWTPTLPMFDRELEVTFEVGIAGTTAGAVERTVRVVDPARRYPLRRSGLDVPVAQHGLVAIDPDGDGTSSLLVAAATGLYEVARVAGTYQQVWAYPFAATLGVPTALAARDVDGDRRPEIFVSSTPSSYYSGGGATLTKLDGVERREAARIALGCLDLELADVDRDGVLDLVCLAGSWTYGSTQRVVVLDPVTLATVWQSEALALGASLAVGNVDADPALEIVTAGGYVFDGATHAVQWRYTAGFGGEVGTGDLDGDGIEEIVGRDGNSYRFRGFSAVLEAPLWEQSTFQYGPLLVTDLDGDGVAEIVLNAEWGKVTAYRYRPATNDLSVVFAASSPQSSPSTLAAADLDGDGVLEIATGSSSGTDALVVAGTGGPEWRSGSDPAALLDGPFVGAFPARLAPGAAPVLLFQDLRSSGTYDGARLVRLDPDGAVSASAGIGTTSGGTGALAVADYDGDGVDEALLATGSSSWQGYFVAWDFLAGRAGWTSPMDVGDGRAILAADVNGDGAPDLVAVTSQGYLMAYDVLHATLIFKSTNVGAGIALALADLDGTGEQKIVVLTTSRVVVFHKAPSGPVPWLEGDSVAVSDAVDLAVADGDGDGLPEIHVLAGWPYAGGMKVQRFDGALAPLGSFAVRGTAQSLFVEDLGSTRKNLVLGKYDPWSYSATTFPVLEAVDAVTGGLIWTSPPLAASVPRSALRYVDLDGDGYREIAFGTSAGMYLTR